MKRAMATRTVRPIVLLTLFCGCSVDPPQGQLACESDADCPPGWICNVSGDGLCYSAESEFPSDTDSETGTDTDADTDTETEITPEDCADAAMIFDFESGEQGFSHGALDGDADPWQLGDPLDQACHSGSSCFATVLSGSYASCTSAELVSPAIDLSVCDGEPQTVELVFRHHYRFQDNWGGGWRDGGAVQLSDDGGLTWQDVAPSQAYEGPVEGDYSGPCGGEVADIDSHDAWSGTIPGDEWNEVTVTVGDELKTSGFRVRFLFGSDRSGEQTGWVVDDVELAVY